MIFETHAHYDDDRFKDDQKEVIEQAFSSGIGRIINIAANLESCKTTIALTQQFENLYGALGVHPSEIACLTEESFQWLKQQCENSQICDKIVAIGEIGLDYYWDKEADVQARQREWFQRQLLLAKELNLPVVIHSRDAAEDTLKVMKEAKAQEIPGVVHCYSYSPELSKEFLKMGYYLGVGGVVTFKNAKKLVDTVAQTPMDRILLETDCPYMAPEPHRGKRNDSRYIPHIVEKIASIKGISVEEVEDITWQNAMTLFEKVRR